MRVLPLHSRNLGTHLPSLTRKNSACLVYDVSVLISLNFTDHNRCIMGGGGRSSCGTELSRTQPNGAKCQNSAGGYFMCVPFHAISLFIKQTRAIRLSKFRKGKKRQKENNSALTDSNSSRLSVQGGFGNIYFSVLPNFSGLFCNAIVL